MQVLVLSSYFTPDIGPGAYRGAALVTELGRKLGDDSQIDAITTLPNRYRSIAIPAPIEETVGNIRIRRIELPAHRGSMRDQALAYRHYMAQVWRATKGKKYDLVVATSSRLLTAVLAALCSRRARAPLYLDIRDLFAENLAELVGGWKSHAVRATFGSLERFAFATAAKISVVSEGFLDHFDRHFPRKPLAYFPNGIDELFLQELAPPQRQDGHARVLLYAGNIGHGQALHKVVPALANGLGASWEFRVIGDGNARRLLADATHGCNTVRLADPVPRETLRREYASSDCLFLHLDNKTAFGKAIPSKIFEYGATGKPILAGVMGHTRAFVQQHLPDAQIFDPCDAEQAAAALTRLELITRPRDEFVAKFRRSTIMKAMVEDILDVARAAHSRKPPGAAPSDGLSA